MEKDFEIEYRDEQIKELREVLAETKREIGYFNPLKGKWENKLFLDSNKVNSGSWSLV